MRSVALFASGGHTELGGLQWFLGRWLPGVRIERRFPTAVLKTKLGRPAPAAADQGVTGGGLVRRAVQVIERHGLPEDAALLFDDADCRFGCASREGLGDFVEDVTRRLRVAAGRSGLPVFVVLASPEVEAWFLAVPAALAARTELHGCADETALRHALRGTLDAPSGGWEAFGCPPVAGGGCSRKLSVALADGLQRLPGATRRYSKDLDGQAVLKSLEPGAVVRTCTSYAADPLRRLRAWAGGAGGEPEPVAR